MVSVDEMDDGDTAFVLISSAMVLLMTPGLAFFYGGLVSGQNVLNTMMMSIICMGIVSVPWFVFGFSLAFGPGGPWIGDGSYVGLQGLQTRLWDGTGIPALLYVIFQLTFAIISAAIVSGAVVERMSFRAFVLFILLWSTLVYDPVAHWVWSPNGWICALGVKDFAGGCVVHILTACSALALAVLLGPRHTLKEKAKQQPHNVPFVILGAGLLWFGWNGFNGGSSLGATKVAVLAVCNTFFSSTTSLVTWALLETLQRGKTTAIGMMTGAIVGLVIITPACGFVSPLGAVIMGSVGCALVYPTFQISHHRVDDSLDCFPCHGASGFVGTILLGFFDQQEGVFYGGGGLLLGKQVAAALAVAVYSGCMSATIFLLLRFFMNMRVSEEEETSGLDSAVHGEEAYSARSTKSGLRERPKQLVPMLKSTSSERFPSERRDNAMAPAHSTVSHTPTAPVGPPPDSARAL